MVLKFTSPGVPDLYQGCELPALVLVDPDNRRPVDYSANAAMLDAIAQRLDSDARATLVPELLGAWQDGRLKLFVTSMLLRLRGTHAAAFGGDYLALAVEGVRAEHLCACARLAGDVTVIVVVSRWAATLCGGAVRPPLGPETWGDSVVVLPRSLPPGTYVDVFTGQGLAVYPPPGEELRLGVATLFSALPCCVLARRENP
jgi:(1->4)-alpha-D-glucan 1-alpha-D-glucosylmutase